MKRMIKDWLVQLFAPDKGTLKAVAEDLRKMAVTAIGVGIIGMALAGDKVTKMEALIVLVIGAILWITGLILTGINGSGE